MWRMVFSCLFLVPLDARAQSRSIPGRDLLQFPIALTGDAAALGPQGGTGLWNPATAILPSGARWRLGVASMSAPADVAVSAQAATIAAAWRATTIGLTLVRASVGGISRTDSDPQSVSNDDVDYSTMVLSAFAARRINEHLVVGVALRTRSGRLDTTTRSGLSLDLGFVSEHLGSVDARLGGSSFLLSPARGAQDRPTYSLGADARVLGVDSVHTVRAGYGAQFTPGFSTEHYLFSSARWGAWEVRGGPLRTDAYGAVNWRLRLGLAIRHAGYALGVAREEGANGLAASYQLTLSSVVK